MKGAKPHGRNGETPLPVRAAPVGYERFSILYTIFINLSVRKTENCLNKTIKMFKSYSQAIDSGQPTLASNPVWVSFPVF